MIIDDLEFQDKNGNEINPTKEQMAILIKHLNKENKHLKSTITTIQQNIRDASAKDYSQIKDLEKEIKDLKKQFAINNEALFLACAYITKIVDKDVNKMAHEWAKHFIEKAKEIVKNGDDCC